MHRFASALCFLAIVAAPLASSAEADVAGFDPEAPADLDKWDGNEWPDEMKVTAAFESQYPAFDSCVAAEKKRSGESTTLAGEAGMALLLNPGGARPMGVNAAMPEAHARKTELTRCLRNATASGQYPSYDGPPLVVRFEFEIDPGSELVDE